MARCPHSCAERRKHAYRNRRTLPRTTHTHCPRSALSDATWGVHVDGTNEEIHSAEGGASRGRGSAVAGYPGSVWLRAVRLDSLAAPSDPAVGAPLLTFWRFAQNCEKIPAGIAEDDTFAILQWPWLEGGMKLGI